MSKTKIFFIGAAVGIAIASGASIPITYHLSKCPDPSPGNDIIAEQPKPDGPTGWTKPPDTCPECGDKINLQSGMLANNTLGVLVWDDCKNNSYKIPLQFKPRVKHHNIIAGYAPMYDIDTKLFRHTIDAGYFYSFGRVFIGGGLAFQFDKIRLYQVGPRVMAGVTF